WQTGVQVSDTILQEGQGMHGGFVRGSTLNTMAAIGPDFKKGFLDFAPVSNADILPTVAHLLHFTRKDTGTLKGRVVREALGETPAGASSSPGVIPTKSRVSSPAKNLETVLYYQELEGETYVRAACFVRAGSGRQTTNRCE